MCTNENEFSKLTSSLCISLIKDTALRNNRFALRRGSSLKLGLVPKNTRGTVTHCLGHRACKWPLCRDCLLKACRRFYPQECHERFVLVLKKYRSSANVILLVFVDIFQSQSANERAQFMSESVSWMKVVHVFSFCIAVESVAAS